MKTSELRPICERAINERRQIEIDYTDPFKRTKSMRIVAPFDIGLRDTEFAQNLKDNLYAYSADHREGETGKASPQVLVFAIGNIASARLLDTKFDPIACCEQSLKNDKVDWSKKNYNLVPDRDWFVPQPIRI